MIDKNNKEILDKLVKQNPKIKKMTYIELGILLSDLKFGIDWISLSDAHEYLGGYENENRDEKTKKQIEEDWKKVEGKFTDIFLKDIAKIFKQI